MANTREQISLLLQFAVQHARIRNIKGYLEAVEYDLQELEQGISEIKGVPGHSHHEAACPKPAAKNHPSTVGIIDAATAVLATSTSGDHHDLAFHSFTCEQLPRQLTVLSTLEIGSDLRL